MWSNLAASIAWFEYLPDQTGPFTKDHDYELSVIGHSVEAWDWSPCATPMAMPRYRVKNENRAHHLCFSFAVSHNQVKNKPVGSCYKNRASLALSDGTKTNMSRRSNLINAVVAFLVPLPSVLFCLYFLSHYQGDDTNSVSPLWSWCFHHPLLLANVLFFFNVGVLFWLISHVQSSNWMIDLYWTVIPVLLVHYYATHPLAQFDQWRSKMVILLTWVWSIRLNHNYFRREKWQWGAREDWRFADMRLQYGKHWWWISFFSVYFSQQILLIGICLPMYVVHSVDKPLNIWDFVAAGVCLCGIFIAYFADTKLHNFVAKNSKLKELGKPMIHILDRGLWRYSRHPNYFGEQLWWSGLAVYAWNLGHGWACVGCLINSMCLAYVTVLVEQRMLKQEYRAEAYKLYQKTTSVWVPWFSSSVIAVKDKDT